MPMTITTQAVREMVERLRKIEAYLYKLLRPNAGEELGDIADALSALVEERDRLAAQIAFYEQLTETRNGEVRHLTDRAEAAEKMLAAVRDDAMKADNLLCAMEARAEAAEAALREGGLPWRPMTSLDLHEAYEAHGPYCALMFHDGHFAMPCDPHTLLDQDIEGTLWVTVDEIPPPSAALQGRDGDG